MCIHLWLYTPRSTAVTCEPIENYVHATSSTVGAASSPLPPTTSLKNQDLYLFGELPARRWPRSEGRASSEVVLDDIWNTIPAARVEVDKNSRTTGTNSTTVEVLVATATRPSQGAGTSSGKSLSEALTAYPFVREVWREIKEGGGGSTASNYASFCKSLVSH